MKSFLLSITLVALTILPAIANDSTPTAVIESAVALLAEKMDGRREELASDRDSLYALIDEVLLPRFDQKFAAQMVLAKHWRTADEAQRTRFIDAFYQALLRRYADGLLEFEQDQVKVLPFRGDDSKPRAKVKSTVELSDGTKVAVDYELVKRESGWLLFNVVIEGVSYIRNFRTEIDSEIRSTSLEAVIERLEGEAGI
ncbi:MAG: ABC transporter substrate-binding protein [Gammaproteobacteria bacterium]|jgi:phospholipid transport system substrate-binding protein|nr:ABC transporter substrate-binding protein [Gammaproteobacteria bacterium]